MALHAHQQTPVSNAIKHHTPLHGKVKFGVLDLEIIHHMFYEAAFWRTQAMNSHIVDADAFDHDFGYAVMEGLTLGLGGPGAVALVNHWGRTQSVDNGVPSRLAHLTKILGRGMCDQYWETMHRYGFAAAQHYATNVEGLRSQARDQVLEMYRTTTNHNLALAAQAEVARKTFSAILTIAEVSMVVVGCMISCGSTAALGPVFLDTGLSSTTLMGGTLLESSAASWAGTAISLGYGVAAEAVKGQPGVWGAIGVKCEGSAWKKSHSVAAGASKILIDRHLKNQTTGFEGAVAKVKQLSGQFKVTSKLANITPRAPAEQALKNSVARAVVLKKAVPMIWAVPSVISILQDGMKRWNDD